MKAIIFDMDGVLIDSEQLHYVSDAKALNLFGAGVQSEDMRGYAGMGNDDFFELMRERYGLCAEIDELIRHKNRFLAEELGKDLRIMPGIESLITGVQRLPLTRALASSSYREIIDLVLNGMGLTQWFDAIVAGNEVDCTKPAPDIFLKAAAKLMVSPADCVAIEDSENGITAARNAGMKTIGFVNPGSGLQDLSMAEETVYRLPDVLPILRRMI